MDVAEQFSDKDNANKAEVLVFKKTNTAKKINLAFDDKVKINYNILFYLFVIKNFKI